MLEKGTESLTINLTLGDLLIYAMITYSIKYLLRWVFFSSAVTAATYGIFAVGEHKVHKLTLLLKDNIYYCAHRHLKSASLGAEPQKTRSIFCHFATF